MGGSSGTFGGSGRSPAEIAQKLRNDAEAGAAEFDTVLADEFGKLLSRYNARDTEEVGQRLGEIKAVLGDDLEGTFDTMFGGSVAKHTYVDGISDVDSILIISGELADATPHEILKQVGDALYDGLNGPSEVSTGRVAVTVKYLDGPEIQLIPAIKKDGKLHVPAWQENLWSSIDPQKFKDGLTKRNAECAGKVVPTLKLAKAINANLPEAARLSGYHIESLGVAAFRGYAEERTTVRMLPYFFKQASTLVLTPMTDRTGQSVHVDEYLGAANSEARVAISHTLARIHQRMLNASTAQSSERWLDLFGE